MRRGRAGDERIEDRLLAAVEVLAADRDAAFRRELLRAALQRARDLELHGVVPRVVVHLADEDRLSLREARRDLTRRMEARARRVIDDLAGGAGTKSGISASLTWREDRTGGGRVAAQW